jgi:hypothetical protein
MQALSKVAILAILFGAGCAQHDETAPAEIVRLTITPDSLTIREGEQYQFVAQTENADPTSVMFASSSESVLHAAQSGKVTALHPGISTVTAFILGKSSAQATSVVTVIPPNPTSPGFNVIPSAATLHKGDELQLTVTSSATGVAYSTSNPGVAAISASGVVHALVTGHATITAALSPDKTATMELDVVN